MSTERCWVCDGTELTVFFEATSMPIHCNVLWACAEEARAAPRGAIHLALCTSCGMVMNLAFDADSVTYTAAYENSLHFSPRFQRYAAELARTLIERLSLKGKTILEIGCGTGEFLQLLCTGGRNNGMGFDPSYEPNRDTEGAQDNVTIVPEPFSSADVSLTADLICCRHVLEHTPAPRAFLEEVSKVADRRPGCSVFFEVPNALYTLRDLGIWDIIYEHCSYFSAPSLARQFASVGFEIRDLYTAFGDQYLCLEAGGGGGRNLPANRWVPQVQELIELVEVFANHYSEKVDIWSDRLGRLLDQGRRVVLWGAGSKGVTFLNTVVGGESIAHVVDLNPRKQGKFIPGVGQVVASPESLRQVEPDVVLVMNAIYEEEIQALLIDLGVQADLETV